MPQSWILPVTLHSAPFASEPLEAKHAPACSRRQTPELFRHTAQHPPEWSVSGFEREIAAVNAIHDSVALAIVLNATNQAIGRTTFMEIRPEHRGVEIGRTWIGRAHHGTSVNPEIKYLMLRHAFESLPPQPSRVQFVTGGTNLHSQTAIAKLGAVKRASSATSAASATSWTRLSRTSRDAVYYSILAAEWPAAKQRLEARIAVFPVPPRA